MSILYSIIEVRKFALGKFTARKCPCCDNDGIEYWDEDGIAPGPSPRKEWGEDFGSGACQNCNGIGYIIQFHE